MAEKLFTPEDFDKPVDIPWYKKKKNWIIFGICLVVIILSCLWYSGNKEETVIPKPDTPPTNVGDTTNVDNDTTVVAPNDSTDVVNKERSTDKNATNLSDDNPQNDIPQSEPTVTVIKRGESLEVDAKMAIRGDYGNGHARKANLGADYQTVQSIVNQRIREGKIYW